MSVQIEKGQGGIRTRVEGNRAMRKREKAERELIADRWKRGGILAALIAAFAVFAVMLQLEKNTLTKYERGSIYVAVREIPRGQMITADNRELYFEEKLLDKSCIPATALSQPEQTEGLAAAFAIAQGTLLTEEMFEYRKDILQEMEHPVIAGFKADDLYQVVGGVLRAGDRIHIYRILDDAETVEQVGTVVPGSAAEAGVLVGEAGSGMGTGMTANAVKEQKSGKRAVLIWENVYVQDVFDQTGNRIMSGDTETSAQRVNVYLDKDDVEAFYAELASGTLRVVKDCK